jgi:hypothetical protein
MAGMKTNARILTVIGTLSLLLPLLTSSTRASATVPDQHLVGQWDGQNRFSGMSYREITKHTAAIQDVETVVIIAADGAVSGHIGGAEFSGCVVEKNRGWLGRALHLKTDFIILGDLAGAVVPGSAGGSHRINAPFGLHDTQIDGTVFVIQGGFSCPYPMLQLRLRR